jgi:type II secretory pathway pseudopilin PulG
VVNARRGSILLELTAVVLILAGALAALASALFGYVRSARAAFEERAASEAALGLLETHDAEGAAALAPGEQERPLPFDSARHLKDGRCVVRRAPHPSGGDTIEVTVSWTDITDRPRTIRRSAFVSPEAP